MNNKQLLNSAFVPYEELWRSRRVLSVVAVTPDDISFHFVFRLKRYRNPTLWGGTDLPGISDVFAGYLILFLID